MWSRARQTCLDHQLQSLIPKRKELVTSLGHTHAFRWRRWQRCWQNSIKEAPKWERNLSLHQLCTHQHVEPIIGVIVELIIINAAHQLPRNTCSHGVVGWLPPLSESILVVLRYARNIEKTLIKHLSWFGSPFFGRWLLQSLGLLKQMFVDKKGCKQ